VRLRGLPGTEGGVNERMTTAAKFKLLRSLMIRCADCERPAALYTGRPAARCCWPLPSRDRGRQLPPSGRAPLPIDNERRNVGKDANDVVSTP